MFKRPKPKVMLHIKYISIFFLLIATSSTAQSKPQAGTQGSSLKIDEIYNQLRIIKNIEHEAKSNFQMSKNEKERYYNLMREYNKLKKQMISIESINIKNKLPLNCYKEFFLKGIEFFNQKNFIGSINQFEAAKRCEDFNKLDGIQFGEKKIQAWINLAIENIELQKRNAENEKATSDSLLAISEKRARASLNVALFFGYKETDPTLAVRIAEYNLIHHPDDPSSIEIFKNYISDTSNVYYIKTLNRNSSTINSIAYSSDGKYLLSAGQDSLAIIWDLEQGTILKKLKNENKVNSAVFSPDNKVVLIFSDDNIAKLWDIEEDSIIRIFQNPFNTFYSKLGGNAVFSPDGKFILITAEDAGAILFEVNTGKLVRRFYENNKLSNGQPSYVSSVAYSPFGKHIITIGENCIIFWQISNGKILWRYNDRENNIYSAVISPSCKEILIGFGTKSFKLIDIKTGKTIQTLKTTDSFEAVFSPDGKRILTGGETKLWDTKTGKLLKNINSGSISTNSRSVAFSPDGSKVAIAYNDGIQIFEFTNGGAIKDFKGHKDWISSIVFMKGSNRFLTGSWDHTVKLWNLQNREPIATFKGHTDAVNSIAYSPDEETILTGSDDRTVRIWNASNGKTIRVITDFQDDIEKVSFSPDGKSFLTLSADTIKIWKFPECKLFQIISNQDYSFNEVVYSNDGLNLITYNPREHKNWIWDIKTGEKIGTSEEEINSKNQTYSSRKKWLLIPEGLLKWETGIGGNIIQKFIGHEESITVSVLSPNEELVLTGDQKGNIKLWLTYDTILRDFVYHFTLYELHRKGVQLEP